MVSKEISVEEQDEYAALLLSNDPAREYVTVLVEELCDRCSGSGKVPATYKGRPLPPWKRAPKVCPACKGVDSTKLVSTRRVDR